MILENWRVKTSDFLRADKATMSPGLVSISSARNISSSSRSIPDMTGHQCEAARPGVTLSMRGPTRTPKLPFRASGSRTFRFLRRTATTKEGLE